MQVNINSVTKQYGDYVALDQVSAEIPTGSIFGLLGPNGAGKTSLIRILNQITGPDEGQILLDGKPIKPIDVNRIGYLPEERGLYKKMEVGEQSMYLARLKGLDSKQAKIALKDWFERFEIQDWWKKKVEELSKGMAQKVQFITTVLHNPELLIFDEPFSGFDPINAELIKNEILELNRKGTTVIFSTHRMESVEQMCDHIALISRSKFVLNGPLNEIRERFRDNTYRLEIKDPSANGNFVLPAGAILVEEKMDQNLLTKIVRLENADTTPLLRAGMEVGKIQLLSEVIPSVNEIFIQTVKESHE